MSVVAGERLLMAVILRGAQVQVSDCTYKAM